MTNRIQFTFGGETITSRPGQSVAAALTEAGCREFRTTKSGAARGMFCGMGVCQDCLVEINGTANQRACLAKAEAGLTIFPQGPFATFSNEPQSAVDPADLPSRHIAPDVLVIGGGAGGLNAARAAAMAGANVVLLDERKVSGGQYYKQTAAGIDQPALDRQQSRGTDLLESAIAAGVIIIREAEVWGAFDGPVIYANVNGISLAAEPKALIIATGAYERPIMVPGWTLPGVMTTGAAQTLWRSYRTLAGKRVAIVGSGPLNFQVALELQSGGADVRVVAETAAAPWWHPFIAASLFASDARLAFKGANMLCRLAARSVKLKFNTNLRRVETSENGLLISVQTAGGRLEQIEVDALCMNGGFQPQNEILRLLGVDMAFDPESDQLRPIRSQTMETSVKDLYAVGDCCGLGGAPAAEIEGRIAGEAATRALNRNEAYAVSERDVSAIARQRRFQNLLWRLHNAAMPSLDELAPETIVCRCEEITRSDIDAALADTSGEIGSLKRATRLGMGTCQGRYCTPIVAPYLAAARDEPVNDLAYFAPRVPIKPVPISSIVATSGSKHGLGSDRKPDA